MRGGVSTRSPLLLLFKFATHMRFFQSPKTSSLSSVAMTSWRVALSMRPSRRTSSMRSGSKLVRARALSMSALV